MADTWAAIDDCHEASCRLSECDLFENRLDGARLKRQG